MQTIFVMVKCDLGHAYQVADEVVDIPQVSEVHSISGQYDLLVKCYLEAGQDVGEFVVDSLQKLPGIRDTFTIIAYKAFG